MLVTVWVEGGGGGGGGGWFCVVPTGDVEGDVDAWPSDEDAPTGENTVKLPVDDPPFSPLAAITTRLEVIGCMRNTTI